MTISDLGVINNENNMIYQHNTYNCSKGCFSGRCKVEVPLNRDYQRGI